MDSPFSPATQAAAEEFVNFLNKAVTPFHAVKELTDRLKSHGFVELKETDSWKLEANGKYYITKNKSAVMALAVGGKYEASNGFSLMAAHTDSPALRVKPVSKITNEGYLQVGVSTYGGGIWRTWFDRDLSLAGLVIHNKDGMLMRSLVNISKPLLYIPNLAIHFCKDRSKFECNNEEELKPILATYIADQLNEKNNSSVGLIKSVIFFVQNIYLCTMCSSEKCEEHHHGLLEVISREVGCSVLDILDFDLYLYNSQPAAIGGLYNEFIGSQRLDNLVGAYTAITGLLESLNDGSLAEDSNMRVVACYDNEECGSGSAQGAESSVTEWFLRRLCKSFNGCFEEAIAKSFMLSVDNAHAINPNYADKHERNHKPKFHGGVVMKVNVNQRYATNSTTGAVIRRIAQLANEPLQKVVVRNDMPCGTTVGPILSSKLGLQTCDVGSAQLAMHSIRELICTSAIEHGIKLYSAYFRLLPKVLKSIV
uniref:Aspartyl aminopeptidase n=1 Tax=Syphacia muris TaxID=451379 RepID=A0A0N5APC7_9BILA